MRSAQLFLRTLHAHAAKLPHEIILKREREERVGPASLGVYTHM